MDEIIDPFGRDVNQFREARNGGLSALRQTRSSMQDQYSFLQSNGNASVKTADTSISGTRAVDFMGRQNGSSLELMFAGQNTPDQGLFRSNLAIDSKVDANTKILGQKAAKATLNPDGTLSDVSKGYVQFDLGPRSNSQMVRDTMLNRDLYDKLSGTGAFGKAGDALKGNLEKIASNLGEDTTRARELMSSIYAGQPSEALEKAHAEGIFKGTTWEQGVPEQYRTVSSPKLSSPTEPSVGKNAELLGVKGNGKLSIQNSVLDPDIADALINEADLGSTPQEDLKRVKFTPAETPPAEPPKATEPPPAEPPKAAETPPAETPESAKTGSSSTGTGKRRARPELLGGSSSRTKLGEGLSGFLGSVKDRVISAKDAVMDRLTPVGNSLANSAAVGKAKSMGSTLASKATGLIGENNVDKLKRFFGKSRVDKPSKLDQAVNKATELGGEIKEQAVKLGGQVKDRVTELGSKAGEVADKVSNLTAQEAAAAVKDTAQNAVTKAKDMGSAIFNRTQENLASDLADKVKSTVAGNSEGAAESAAKTAAEGASTAEKAVADGAAKTEQVADDFLKGMKKNKLVTAGIGGALLFAGAHAFFGNGQRRNEDLYGRPF